MFCETSRLAHVVLYCVDRIDLLCLSLLGTIWIFQVLSLINEVLTLLQHVGGNDISHVIQSRNLVGGKGSHLGSSTHMCILRSLRSKKKRRVPELFCLGW